MNINNGSFKKIYLEVSFIFDHEWYFLALALAGSSVLMPNNLYINVPPHPFSLWQSYFPYFEFLCMS